MALSALRRMRRLGCLALVAHLAMELPARAQAPPQDAPQALPPRPDPRTVPRPAERRIKVTSLSIDGATAVSAAQIRAVLGTRVSSWIPWGRKRYFDRAVFETDMKRIEAFYYDRGYPDAQVASFDAKLNDKQDAIALSVTVKEGPPVVLDRIVFENFDELRTPALDALRAQLPLQPGDPLDTALLTATRTMAARALQDRGFPSAEVSAEESRTADKHVTLTLVAAPGPEARYGAVTVSGNRGVGEDVILRTLAFKPGNRFSLASVQLSQRRLYDMGLFQLATVVPQNQEISGGMVPVTVTVAEAKHRQIRLSAGYGSEEHLRGEAQWKRLNFFGGARTATVDGKWSGLERGLRGTFKQPYLFSPKLTLTLSTQAWFTDEPAFQLETNGGRGTVNYDLTRRNAVSGRGADSTIAVSFIAEHETYAVTPDALADLSLRTQLIALGLDPRTGEGRGLLSALAFDYRRSTATNVLDATNGYTVQAHAERAGGWLAGDFTYHEYSVEARHYQRLGNLGVLATRGRLGTIDGVGREEDLVPFFKRYFLGGSNSLRGWGRFEVSPLSGSGLPIGGNSLIEFSTEMRAPLFGKVSGVLFLDGGSVATTAWDVAFEDLRYDVGPGLRYLTPIGPLRMDFAYQLTRIPGLLVDGLPEPRRWRIHFSLGQAF
jgi:outer membrane protein assembly complex protein YaeT